MDNVLAELLPEDKVEAVRALKGEGRKVVMVGDGVNDAPAFAVSDTSVAMGGIGSDAALETADVVLMGDDIGKLPWTVGLSRRTMRIVKFNITASLLIKGVFIILAVTGHATLWAAVAADMGTSLTVVFNSRWCQQFFALSSFPDLLPSRPDNLSAKLL